MFFDPFAPPRILMDNEQAAAVIKAIHFQVDGQGAPGPSAWVHVEPSFKQSICEAAGLSWSDLLSASANPSLRVDMSAQLADVVSSNCIYRVSENSFSSLYYLDYVPHLGRLFVNYQHILGSRFLAKFESAQQDALFERLVEQAKDFGKSEDFARVQRKAHEVRVSVARRNGEPIPLATDAPSVAALPKADAELQEELATLAPNGSKLMLPENHLEHYAAIKRLLEVAGAKYVARKKCFEFADGRDAASVLEQLLGGQSVNPKKDYQFFASTEPVMRLMRSLLPDLAGLDVLEPSAGDGALADMAQDMGAKVTTVELWDANAKVLRNKGYSPVEQDFLALTPQEIGLFDVIVANPPFSGGRDIEHFMHMTKFLKPGGTLCCVMSTTWQQGSQRKQLAFRDFLAQEDVSIDSLPAGTFKESGTGVGALVVTLKAPLSVSSVSPKTLAMV